MAGTFLSDAELERFNAFPQHIPADDLIKFFTLSNLDKEEIEKLLNGSGSLNSKGSYIPKNFIMKFVFPFFNLKTSLQPSSDANKHACR